MRRQRRLPPVHVQDVPRRGWADLGRSRNNGRNADSTKRLLSARIHLGEAIFVSGNDYWKLTGRIEQRGTNLVADLVGDTGSQGQFYKGEIRLEKPFFGQGGTFSGGVVPIWFAVSTNSDSKPVLESLEKMRKQRLEKSR